MRPARASHGGPAAPVDKPDVLVVGAGVAGLFAAYYLRQAGADVAVAERGQVGGPQSCSAGNTGFVGTQGAAPLAEAGALSFWPWQRGAGHRITVVPRPDPMLASWLRHFRLACAEQQFAAGFRTLLELKRRSLAQLRELCAVQGLAGTFAAPGMVIAYRTADGFDRACRSVPAAVAGGVPLRVLQAEQLRELDPGVRLAIHGALFNAEGAYLRAGEFVTALAAELRRLGVRIYQQAEVTGMDAAGRAVRQVRTTGPLFMPGQVVLAGGSWSARYARWLGIGLQLQPVRGYSVTVPAADGGPRLPVLLGEPRIAVAPLGGQLRLAGGLELAGLHQPVRARRARMLLRSAQAYLPGLAGAAIASSWSGLRPCTPDSLPFIGRAGQYDNLLLATGHGHIGMGIAPAGGRLVAQLACGERPDMDPAQFAVDRFARSAQGVR